MGTLFYTDTITDGHIIYWYNNWWAHYFLLIQSVQSTEMIKSLHPMLFTVSIVLVHSNTVQCLWVNEEARLGRKSFPKSMHPMATNAVAVLNGIKCCLHFLVKPRGEVLDSLVFRQQLQSWTIQLLHKPAKNKESRSKNLPTSCLQGVLSLCSPFVHATPSLYACFQFTLPSQ